MPGIKSPIWNRPSASVRSGPLLPAPGRMSCGREQRFGGVERADWIWLWAQGTPLGWTTRPRTSPWGANRIDCLGPSARETTRVSREFSLMVPDRDLTNPLSGKPEQRRLRRVLMERGRPVHVADSRHVGPTQGFTVGAEDCQFDRRFGVDREVDGGRLDPLGRTDFGEDVIAVGLNMVPRWRRDFAGSWEKEGQPFGP